MRAEDSPYFGVEFQGKRRKFLATLVQTLGHGGRGLASISLGSFLSNSVQAKIASPENAGPQTLGKVEPGRLLVFPRDHGAHPDFRTEWWYLTGMIEATSSTPLTGFQVTFFRSRTSHPEDNPSSFAPKQLLFAHIAVARASQGKLLHEQAASRMGFESLAFASSRDCDLNLFGWKMRRQNNDTYTIDIQTPKLQCALVLSTASSPVLQGEKGFSQKGPKRQQASYYYSRPQLEVRGRITVKTTHEAAPQATPTDPTSAAPSNTLTSSASTSGASVSSASVSSTLTSSTLTSKLIKTEETRSPVAGLAWMDHEWSNEVLDAQAAGWDWVGLNLDDGTSLMAFQIRPKRERPTQSMGDESRASGDSLWKDAAWIENNSTSKPTVNFQAQGFWRSLRSNANYPVRMSLRVQLNTVNEAGSAQRVGGRSMTRQFELRPLMDDQEVDARASTGGYYWEGLVTVFEDGRRIGQGYLELTGYAAPLRI